MDEKESGSAPFRFASVDPEGRVPMEEGMLEKIREILLGQEKRESQRRFRVLEERLLSILEEHQRTTARRFEKLEGRIQRDLESLEAKVRGEKQERIQSLEELREVSEGLLNNFEKEKREIDRNKLDRFTMAEVFVETAMRLSQREEASEDAE